MRIGKCQMLISCLCCGSPDKCRRVTQDLVNDTCKVRMLKDLHYITSADPQVYTIVFGCSLAAPAPGCWCSSQRSGHCGSLCHHPWLTLPKHRLKQTCASTCGCDKQLTQPSQMLARIDTGKSLSSCHQGNDTCGSGTSFASSPQ